MKTLRYFAITLLMFPLQLLAGTCEVTLNGSDSMKYDVSEIKMDASCSEFKLVLNHSGKLPANIMGHNVVVVKDSDFQTVIGSINMAHGAQGGYLPSDAPVLLKTGLIGGGETTEVTVNASAFKTGESYTFFCSFPGHYAMMKGAFSLN
jgi:azurin